MNVMAQEQGRDWVMFNGDSAEVLRGLPDDSVDFSVYSPPFQALYVYSPTERDLGNCRTPEEFFEHMSFITSELYRVLKPGRVMAVHCAQITAQKVLDGWIGLKDFRGQLIEHYGKHGFYFHREVCIDKDPQAQAIRTHSKALLFVQMRKDRSWIGPAIADYILFFRKGTGDPEIRIDQEPLTEDDWIEWARHPRDGHPAGASEAERRTPRRPVAARRHRALRAAVDQPGRGGALTLRRHRFRRIRGPAAWASLHRHRAEA